MVKTVPPPLPGSTLGTWLAYAERRYRVEGVALGQVATNAHDDALFLLLRTLDLPIDSDSEVLDHKLSRKEAALVRDALERRIVDRVPSAYIVGEAWLGGLCFHVDPRVIVPRSYFVELVPKIRRLLPKGTRVRRVADICTGSGCLAILLAGEFSAAQVDAIDISPDALEVARINVRAHRLVNRIALRESDVLTSVPPAEYEVIVSNPPYEPSRQVDKLPAEFQGEPRLALDGGTDGMTIIRRIVQQSIPRLASGGVLLMEVGGLRRAIDREFKRYKPEWLETEDGSDCVCVLRKS